MCHLLLNYGYYGGAKLIGQFGFGTYEIARLKGDGKKLEYKKYIQVQKK